MNRPQQAIVTGLGCLCAAGGSLDATMESLYAGRRDPRPARRVRVDLETEHPVFEIDSDLEAETAALGLENNGPRLSRTNALALLAVAEACGQAGLDLRQLAGLRVGICLGTTVGCTLNNEPFYRAWRSGENPSLGALDAYLGNNPTLALARILGLSGPVATLANACSSGADAVGMAAGWLRDGRCDIALAGGADELSRVTFLGFASLMIAAPEPCRPFDRRRVGLNLGEGAGVLVLETAESARGRGARFLAEMAGYATNADAHHPTAPHPEGRGLRRALGRALAQAGVAANGVGFANAHGTSTPENDRVEGKVLSDLLPEGTPVVSTKAYTGHTLGAAGGIEAALSVRALLDGRLPATAGFEEADPECDLTPTTAVTPLRAPVGVSNSLAFGGSNSVLVFREASGGLA